MYKNLLIVFLTQLILACSSKEIVNKNLEFKAIEYTKKIDIIENQEIKLIFWATYLNDLMTVDSNKESFLISIYDLNIENLQKPNITLNDKKYSYIKEVKHENLYFKELTKRNPWGKNYLIKFDKEKSDILKLELKNKLKKISITIKRF